MAKKPSQTDTKKATTPKQGKPPKKRMIYRHHRKFVGGGLVGLIILSFLVGAEILPMQMPATGAQKPADIKVLDGSENKTVDPSRPHQSVVARNEDGQSDAVIKLHNNKSDENTAADNLRESIKKLHQITQAQQQMIRMLSQRQSQTTKELKEQVQNVSLQVANALEADQPTLFKINQSLTLLQLRQDALYFQNQWEQGFLTAQNLYQWQVYTKNHGFDQAAQVAGDLAESIETFGSLNRRALRQTALLAQNTPSAEKPQTSQDGNEQEQTAQDEQTTQAQAPSLWQKLKSRLAGLVSVRRVSQEESKTTSREYRQLRDKLAEALAQGHMANFWQLVHSEDLSQSQDPFVERLRVLVDAHMTQTNAFQQLYQALTAAKKN